MSHPIQELSDLFADMPGVGPRQARRIVQFLLRSDARYKKQLSEGIQSIAEKISQCAQCFRFDEINAQKLCVLCANKERTSETLMVIEKDVDIESIEQSDVYRGAYFVLGGLIPLARQRKNTIAPRVDFLKKRLLHDKAIQEVVLAFATTPEGDNTAREIAALMREHFPTIKVSQLGRGLSLGAEIEYADQETIRNAFVGRH